MVNRSSPRGLRPALFLLLLLAAALPGCADTPTRSSGWTVSFPGAILLDDAFPKLVVEVTYAGDRAPSETALSAFQETLRTHATKDTITFLSPRRIEPLGPAVRSHDELRAVHDSVRQHGTGAWPWNHDTFYLHVLYADGDASDGSAGAYHGKGRITVMSDQIFTQVGPYSAGERETPVEELTERRMLVHELGHAFGLVNCGIPMVRSHESMPPTCHSDRTRSVLNGTSWTPPHDDAGRSLQDTVEVNWHFDEFDLEDLASFKRTGRTFTGEAPV